MQTLSPPIVGPEDASRVMAGVVWSMLDAYDRKLVRDKYEEIVDGSVRLVQLLARLGLSQIMVNMQENGALTPEKLAEAVEDLKVRCEVERKKLHAKMELVVQCPWENDPVH